MKKINLLLFIILFSVMLSYYNCSNGGGGGGEIPSTTQDDDNDGVINSKDNCPNTPSGASVNANGCSATQLGEKDDDNDGVKNSTDNCPNTVAGQSVDANGCAENQKDDDNDGVVNSSDNCPNTPSGESVDNNGCVISGTRDIVIDKSSLVYDINEFVWRGLNYYYWVDDVENLDSATFDNSVDKLDSNLLLTYDNPGKLFRALLYKYNDVDKHSLIYDDYTELEHALGRIALKGGVQFGGYVYNGEVRGYILYVTPGFNTYDQKLLKRGDIFTHIDGTKLTSSNYANLFSSITTKTSYTLTLLNGNVVTVVQQVKTENPILLTKVFVNGSKKIGYLVLNGFLTGYEEAINDSIGKLKNEGINELILDLRYNGGGLVTISQMLASSIAGQSRVGNIFLKFKYNDALTAEYNQKSNSDEYFENKFVDKIPDNGAAINFLNLSRLYVLTTGRTASASEIIINSLKPYMTVTLIGRKTLGKNVGSITLYDSDNFMRDHASLNANHKWAMQPIIFELANVNNFSDYSNGFSVNEDVYEVDYLGTNDSLLPLGDPSEPLLAKAISLITGGSSSSTYNDHGVRAYRNSSKDLYNEEMSQPFENDMYLRMKDLPEAVRNDLLLRFKRK